MFKKIYVLQKYSGVIGIVVLWAAITTAMSRAHLGLIDFRPISFLGVNPPTARWFSVGMLVSSVLFVNFAFFVKRLYQTNKRFMLYFMIGQAGQVIAAITPYGQGTYKLIHTIGAFALAFSLPFLIREFASSQKTAHHTLLFRRLVKLEIATFIIGMGIFTLTKGIAPIGEALPAIGFHLWIIATTIVARHGSRKNQPLKKAGFV